MDFHSTKPIYLQIADFICEEIFAKKWEIGEKIPSVREMAIELQVNPNTVARTYLFLEEKNIIKTQRGIGYFVIPESQAAITTVKKEEFLTMDLPRIFKTMDLLEMTFEDFRQLYAKRGKHHEKK
jgi:GntR family transcriptional regulator